MGAIGSASAQQHLQKEGHVSPGWAGGGFTAKIVLLGKFADGHVASLTLGAAPRRITEARNFGPLHPLGPHPLPHPSGPHPSGPHPLLCFFILLFFFLKKKAKRLKHQSSRFGQSRSNQDGQSRSNVFGQSRFGQSRNWHKDGQSRIGQSRHQPIGPPAPGYVPKNVWVVCFL